MSYMYQTRQRSAGGRSRFAGNSRGRSQRGQRGSKQYIHPSRFIRAARQVEAEVYAPINQFADFKVHPLLTENIAKKGLVTPTPIQDQAIPYSLEGKDVVGIANTGTGKTIAFAVPVLHRLLADQNARALIMAPTRELAQQIEDECRTIGKGAGFGGALLIGGVAMGPQLRDLRSDPRIVIGTPGRIKDHIERGTLKPAGFNIVVLDEVDRMLDMGFIADMRDILKQLATERQSFFFSATMDPKVAGLINSFTNEAITVSVKTGETSDNVEQDVVAFAGSSHKLEQLHELLNRTDVVKALVFDETQRSVERLHRELQARGFKSDAIHGGKSQSQRQRAVTKFKNNDVTVLVATDVAARGIDIADISHVINYATPQAYEDYVHRIGRAGRAGRKGFAFTFVSKDEIVRADYAR